MVVGSGQLHCSSGQQSWSLMLRTRLLCGDCAVTLPSVALSTLTEHNKPNSLRPFALRAESFRLMLHAPYSERCAAAAICSFARPHHFTFAEARCAPLTAFAMSALRKLRQARLASQQQQLQTATTAAASAETAEADDDDDIAAERQQRANVMQAAFSILQAEDEDSQEADDDDEPATDSPQTATVGVSETASTSSAEPQAASVEDEEDEEDEDGEHDDKPSRGRSGRGTRRPSKQPSQPSKASRQQPSSSKAKGAKKGKEQAAENGDEKEEEEDIDSLLAELDQQRSTDTSKRTGGSKRAVAGDEADGCDWSFLATQQKHLDSNSEVRARFGSTAVHRAAAAEREGEEKAPRGMVRRRPQGAAVTAIARRQRLVKVGDDWPPMVDRGDLKMVRIDPSSSSSASRGLSPISSSGSPPLPPPSRTSWLLTSSTCPLFSFRYSSDYDRLQQEYLSAISSHDIQAVLYFARQHPYHVDCCVQLSELSESQGEFIVAHAAIQRALHMYDLSLHREFDLYSGRCRLDGDVRENRGLFVALARHAQMLGKKGYSRTALEVCKLLLSLSPLLDPQCVALFIDYHAIRAHQYAWLVELPHRLDVAVTEMTRSQPPWQGRRVDEPPAVPKEESKDEKEKAALPVVRVPAVLLPNLVYARAMAAYYLEQQESKDQSVDALQPQIAPPLALFPRISHILHPLFLVLVLVSDRRQPYYLVVPSSPRRVAVSRGRVSAATAERP